jgi:hypothetical protein
MKCTLWPPSWRSWASFIENYENAHYPIPEAEPRAALRFLMEEHGLKQTDLPEIGTQGVVSEILAGKRVDQRPASQGARGALSCVAGRVYLKAHARLPKRIQPHVTRFVGRRVWEAFEKVYLRLGHRHGDTS